MALIRISGGIDGGPAYLKNGVKQGQELTRDQLDERIVLSGDLDITTEIIESVPGTGDRYLHITLSVKERDLPVETFRQIDAEIKEMIFAAYRKDSFDYYSELQRPKIKNVLNKSTGEWHERLDHIHILIPLVNLETGRKANPLGLVEHNKRFVDALQEHINIKYGLASPKDNKRENVSTADVIARSKDGEDKFEKGAFKKVKAALREKVGAADISSYEALQTYLAGIGEVKVRNKGKPNEYLAFKPQNGVEFINLRDAEFTKGFFDMPDVERAARLGMGNVESTTSNMFEKRTPEAYEGLLKDWREVRSKEIRYLNSGSKKLYAAYKNATPEEKAEILAELERRAQTKQEKQNDERNNDRHGRDDAGDRGRAAPGDERGLGRVGRGQPDIAPVGTEPPPAARGRLRSMSEWDVAGKSQGSKVLLPGDVRDELVEPGSERVRAGLRRADHQVSDATGRTSDSVLGQIQRDNREAAAARAADAKPTIQAIKKGLDANRLLADLAVTNLLLPSDYVVSLVDGAARIRHKDETNKYNVSDFLTKHMHMSWPEAQRYLEATYDRQQKHIPEPSVAVPARPDMWAAFQAERRATPKATLKQEELDQRSDQRAELRDANDRFKKAKARIRADDSLTPAARKAEISLLTMKKATADIEMKQRHESESAEADRLRKPQEQYRTWLQRKAQAGDQDALAELRAQRTEPARKASVLDRIIGAPDKQPDTHKRVDQVEQERKPQWEYKVARNGDVTYYKQSREMIVDTGRKVYMIDTSDQTLEQGLRLAAIKWGGKMHLSGSELFIRQAVTVAAKKNLNIEFSDPAQNAALRAEKERIRKDHEFVRKNIERHEKELAAEREHGRKLPIQVLREQQRALDAKAAPAQTAAPTPAPAPAKPNLPASSKPAPAIPEPPGTPGTPAPAAPTPAAPEQLAQAPSQQVRHQVIYAPEPEQDDDQEKEQEQEIKPPGS